MNIKLTLVDSRGNQYGMNLDGSIRRINPKLYKTKAGMKAKRRARQDERRAS